MLCNLHIQLKAFEGIEDASTSNFLVTPAVVWHETLGTQEATKTHIRFYSCVFQTIYEIWDAVRNFAARYNAQWLIEKNSYLSPLDTRAARLDTSFRRAALQLWLQKISCGQCCAAPSQCVEVRAK